MKSINEAGIALIKEFEGLALKGYQKTGDVPTIGYGHTGPDVRVGQQITELDADQFLRQDVHEAETIVNHAVRVPLNPNQFAALVSFVFNVGTGRKARGRDPGKDGFVMLKSGNPSTMLRKLNAGDMAGAALEFERWTKGPPGTTRGLIRRRKAERALFEKVP